MDTSLTNLAYITRLLQSHGLHTNKRFGQNFLIDQPALETIVQTANIQPTDRVIEIGTGIGTLTQQLAARAKKLIAFEIDSSLQPILAQTVAEFHNIDLRWQDFMQADLTQLLADLSSYKVVANLPYNAGSHILDILLKSATPPQSITVLLQKEVAQKITASPPNATYLSNFFQTYGQPQVIKIIPPTSFFPAPSVDSAILHIIRQQEQNLSPLTLQTSNLIVFSRFLHRGFANPRKMINKAFSTEQLNQASIDSQNRPENLTFQDWLNLYSIVSNEN